jgi:hypothetical protein
MQSSEQVSQVDFSNFQKDQKLSRQTTLKKPPKTNTDARKEQRRELVRKSTARINSLQERIKRSGSRLLSAQEMVIEQEDVKKQPTGKPDLKKKQTTEGEWKNHAKPPKPAGKIPRITSAKPKP